jgi:hypothetical protein
MEVEPWPNNMERTLRCCWNVSENTLGTWGTCREPVGNFLGTRQEQKKNVYGIYSDNKLIFKL